METTTASLEPHLGAAAVDWATLEEGYGPLLGLVEGLLGVKPECDRYLEIWPPAFRAYNVMVPNLLNLPVPVMGLGGPPPGVVGLAMYVASRTAGCPYCTAHACSFALRRGASPETVASALLPGVELGDGESAAVVVAQALASEPGGLRTADKQALVSSYGESGAEWIALSVVMMGFLNKFMDVVGVGLEQPVVDEVRATLGPGWTPGKAGFALDPTSSAVSVPPVDGFRSRLRVLPLLPGAIRYDGRAQRGTPRTSAAIGRRLGEVTGHDFPVLQGLRSGRARRAIATMLLANLDESTSVVGLRAKVLAGAVYASVVGDLHLADDIAALAVRADVPADELAAVAAGPCADTVVALARDASYSPSLLSPETVAACERDLTPAAVIEVVTWLATLQLLHRLTRYLHPID